MDEIRATNAKLATAAAELDKAASSLAGQMMELGASQTLLGELSGRWSTVADKLIVYSPAMAKNAENIYKLLQELQSVVGHRITETGAITAKAGLLADSLRLSA